MKKVVVLFAAVSSVVVSGDVTYYGAKWQINF